MINAIGIIELNSIAKGITVADAMLKASTVTLLESRPICPGKYLTIIHGDVESVKNSIDIGKSHAKAYLVDSLVIPNIHTQVVKAITGVSSVEKFKAIGVLEFFSITSSILSADFAVKSANVDIVELRLGIAIGGKSFVTLTGDVSAIQEAIKVGKRAGVENGLLFESTIIDSPDQELLKKLV